MLIRYNQSDWDKLWKVLRIVTFFDKTLEAKIPVEIDMLCDANSQTHKAHKCLFGRQHENIKTISFKHIAICSIF